MQCLSRKEDRECESILCPLPIGRYYYFVEPKNCPSEYAALTNVFFICYGIPILPSFLFSAKQAHGAQEVQAGIEPPSFLLGILCVFRRGEGFGIGRQEGFVVINSIQAHLVGQLLGKQFSFVRPLFSVSHSLGISPLFRRNQKQAD